MARMPLLSSPGLDDFWCNIWKTIGTFTRSSNLYCLPNKMGWKRQDLCVNFLGAFSLQFWFK